MKIELDIKRAEQEIEKSYRAMGRIMYRIETGSLNRDEQIIKAACHQIQSQEELIEKLKADKEDLKNRSDEEGPIDVEGQEVSAEESSENEEESPKPEKNKDGYFVLKFCPKCRVGNHPDADTCVNCGHKF